MSMANNRQILAFLSFLPIGNECAKLAFRRGHELFQKQAALAIFPMKRAKYCALQRKDVFPEPFRGNKPHISVFAGLSGLSWAQPTVPYLTPVLSVGQISLLLRPSLYAPHNIVVDDTSTPNVDEGSHGNNLLVLVREEFWRAYSLNS